MGALVDGRWVREEHFPTKDGAFQRAQSQFRNHVSDDPVNPYQPDAGRYRLYVSLACPWAHRTIILRKLKGLEDAIPMTVVDPYMGPEGWAFSDRPGCGLDPETGAKYLRELYLHTRPKYSGRVTTPVLWDRATQTIVNNESADIMRMLNRAFDEYGDSSVDCIPPDLRVEIDRRN